MKTASNPIGEVVVYDDSRHTYTVRETGGRLTSVTTFIKQFTPAFDAPTVAVQCAGKGKYTGMSPDQVMEEWTKEGSRGRKEGTRLHLFAECYMKNLPLPDPENEREEKIFATVQRAINDLKRRFVLIDTEVILFSVQMGLAGTADLLMLDPKNSDVLIIDWKQNKKIKTSNLWNMMLPPINTLEASDLIQYGLQLSLYKMFYLSYFPPDNAPRVRTSIIHIGEDSFSAYPIKEYYSAEIERMLNAFRQKAQRR